MADQTVTPWTVEAAKSENGSMQSINYDHVITQFGCQKFESSFLDDIEKLTGAKPHRLLRRGLTFAHRDFDKIIECIREKKKFFLYTGRGPSSRSMHIGHSIPFVLCKYLQDAFGCPFVVQMTDDEKFLFKNITLREAIDNGHENMKDIIAFGLNPDLTYIFSNLENSHLFKENILKVAKLINLNEAFKVFGFDMTSSIGMIEFPAKEIAPAFSSSFAFLPPKMPCLIPCAVDQDPFFRLARDKANSLGEIKPASLYVSLLPDLNGVNRKMSASDSTSSIYLTDDPETIRNKIKKHAFSGGQETLKLHKQLGGNVELDVSFQYLRYFLEDDEELERLRQGYADGTVLSSEMKQKCIEEVQKFVKEFQATRGKVSDRVVDRFKSISKFKEEAILEALQNCAIEEKK